MCQVVTEFDAIKNIYSNCAKSSTVKDLNDLLLKIELKMLQKCLFLEPLQPHNVMQLILKEHRFVQLDDLQLHFPNIL